jgi:hypothetical protein
VEREQAAALTGVKRSREGAATVALVWESRAQGRGEGFASAREREGDHCSALCGG